MGEPSPARSSRRRRQLPAGRLRERQAEPESADTRAFAETVQAGDIQAQVRLGRLCVFTLNPPDMSEARIRWTKAAAAGHTADSLTTGDQAHL